MPKMWDNMTDKGRNEYKLYDKYGLGVYYVPQQGNVNIPAEDFPSVFENVVAFMQDHRNYYCGYEDFGMGEGVYWVSSWIN